MDWLLVSTMVHAVGYIATRTVASTTVPWAQQICPHSYLAKLSITRWLNALELMFPHALWHLLW